jgi:hypothetical protein
VRCDDGQSSRCWERTEERELNHHKMHIFSRLLSCIRRISYIEETHSFYTFDKLRSIPWSAKEMKAVCNVTWSISSHSKNAWSRREQQRLRPWSLRKSSEVSCSLCWWSLANAESLVMPIMYPEVFIYSEGSILLSWYFRGTIFSNRPVSWQSLRWKYRYSVSRYEWCLRIKLQ